MAEILDKCGESGLARQLRNPIHWDGLLLQHLHAAS